MEKKILFILTIALLLIAFAFFWFDDMITDRFTVFLYPVFPILLFICFASLMIWSIIRIVKCRTKTDIVSLSVLISSVVLILVFPFRSAKVRLELNMLEKPRLEVVEMIKDDQISPENGRDVSLPDGYKTVSSDGTATVFKNDGDGQIVCFWVYRGIIDGGIGVIYSSEGEEMIKENVKWIASVDELKDRWYYVRFD